MAVEKENPWPSPKYYFKVVYYGTDFLFQEASGLDVRPQVVEYRTQSNPMFDKIELPRVNRVRNVTLKKGWSKSGGILLDTFNDAKMGLATASNMTIELIDESGIATLKWTLEKAYLIHMIISNASSASQELAIESMEVTFNLITMTEK